MAFRQPKTYEPGELADLILERKADYSKIYRIQGQIRGYQRSPLRIHVGCLPCTPCFSQKVDGLETILYNLMMRDEEVICDCIVQRRGSHAYVEVHRLEAGEMVLL